MWRQQLDQLFNDWNKRCIITSPDVDGILCALLVLKQFPQSRLLGFYDCERIVLLECEYASAQTRWKEAKEALWLDEDVLQGVRCIGQHLLKKDESDQLTLRNPLSFNPNITFNQCYNDSFHAGRIANARDKYPFGTVHFLMDYFGISDPAQYAVPFIAHADSSYVNVIRYPDNCRIWAQQMFRPGLLDQLLTYVMCAGSDQRFLDHQRAVKALKKAAGPCLAPSKTKEDKVDRWAEFQGNQKIDYPKTQGKNDLQSQVNAFSTWISHLQSVFILLQRETGWNVAENQYNFTLNAFRCGVVSTIEDYPMPKSNKQYRVYTSPVGLQTLDLFLECEGVFSFAIIDKKCLRYTQKITFEESDQDLKRYLTKKRKREDEKEEKEEEEKEEEEEAKKVQKKDSVIKLAIVGSRNFVDFEMFRKHVQGWINEFEKPSLIISGGASGSDALAERFAKENEIPVQVFPADWKKFGKSAGPLRNTEIVAACTHVIAFPSRTGSGTQDTIQKAENAGKPTKIVFID